VELPGKPYTAIRVRYAGGTKPAPSVTAPIEP